MSWQTWLMITNAFSDLVCCRWQTRARTLMVPNFSSPLHLHPGLTDTTLSSARSSEASRFRLFSIISTLQRVPIRPSTYNVMVLLPFSCYWYFHKHFKIHLMNTLRWFTRLRHKAWKVVLWSTSSTLPSLLTVALYPGGKIKPRWRRRVKAVTIVQKIMLHFHDDSPQ